MINTLELSNTLCTGSKVSCEKISNDIVSLCVQKFDTYTGKALTERTHCRMQDIVDKKVQLERELEACRVLLAAANKTGTEQRKSSIGDSKALDDNLIAVEQPPAISKK